MSRFVITNSARTAFGPIACVNGRIAGVILGVVEAPNAADALARARDQWPTLPVRNLGAHLESTVDEADQPPTRPAA